MAAIAELAGVSATTVYWGEGTKSQRLSLANADPVAIRLFVDWVRAYHDATAGFEVRLHLHETHDERDAIDWWLEAIGVPADIGKTSLKPDGTGHRTLSLSHGVCTARVRRSSLMLHRTLGWIDGLSVALPLRSPAA